ncbi:MAG: hypothetical protein ACTJLM_01615 [Ehrlichia sp.]
MFKVKRKYSGITVSYHDDCKNKNSVCIGTLIDDMVKDFIILKNYAIKVKIFVELEGENKITANYIDNVEIDTDSDMILKCNELLVSICGKITKFYDATFSDFISVKTDLFYLASCMSILVLDCVAIMDLIKKKGSYGEKLSDYNLLVIRMREGCNASLG